MSAPGHDLDSLSSREPIPKRQVSQIPLYVTVPEILSNRHHGFYNRPIGFTDAVKASLYSSFDSVELHTDSKNYDNYWGGIFNFEFSHNGKLLIAACEGKQILLHDASNQKRIETIETAHQNCVNCIKFLDERTFATGSDDALIKLWDIRKLDKAMKTLHGHSSWVKNIEWSEQEHVMVTSAFDGTVYAWNLNDRTENNMLFEKVFLLSGLMRMKLTPDGTKMLITTTTGFMIIIHNVNLLTLAIDLRSFRPNLYRLMQTSEQSFPVATTYNYLFDPKRTRNRIEFINDFPNESEVISSLQIHPHGWAAVSRNLNSETNEEWTAVHDIQDRDAKDYEESFMYTEDCDNTFGTPASDESANRGQRPSDLWVGYTLLEDYQALDTAGATRQEMGIVSSGLIGSSAPYDAYFQMHPDERNKVFLLSGLMRMKLTPDGTKMLITTTIGFMIIIHNLNLLTLAIDLRSFRPNLYRLMQTSEQSFPVATTYNYLFDPKRTRNRIEFIDDFPNESEVISSLQIHPHGWAAVSRNLNSEANEEWTAVHDIQDRDAKDYEESFMYTEDCDDSTFLTPSSDESAERGQRPSDLWLGYTSLEDYLALDTAGATREEMGLVSSGLIGSSAPYNAYFQMHPDERNKVILNLKRMTHYIKEKNVGKGFIKEVAISPDGRVICSPYDRGIRLLAFNENCQEMSECIPDEPKELHPILEMSDYHRDVVVSCKFNPVHYQLVTGCLGSQIKWYQPVL